MTPTAQLIAELRDYAESIACGMTLDCPIDRGLVQGAILSAAEALARQEELLAEAGKVVEPFARAVELLDDGESVAIARCDGTILADDDHFRAAARLSDKLKGE